MTRQAHPAEASGSTPLSLLFHLRKDGPDLAKAARKPQAEGEKAKNHMPAPGRPWTVYPELGRPLNLGTRWVPPVTLSQICYAWEHPRCEFEGLSISRFYNAFTLGLGRSGYALAGCGDRAEARYCWVSRREWEV